MEKREVAGSRIRPLRRRMRLLALRVRDAQRLLEGGVFHALQAWLVGHARVLADVVRVIRMTRPLTE